MKMFATLREYRGKAEDAYIAVKTTVPYVGLAYGIARGIYFARRQRSESRALVHDAEGPELDRLGEMTGLQRIEGECDDGFKARLDDRISRL